jgi:hypothetical protein
VTRIRFPSVGIRDEVASPCESVDEITARNSLLDPLESEVTTVLKLVPIFIKHGASPPLRLHAVKNSTVSHFTFCTRNCALDRISTQDLRSSQR